MSKKQERMSGRIRVILSELVLREVADPRLAHITITDVELDPELLYARVYVNALGDEEREQEVMAGLERAKGFLRRELGQRVRLRKTPELHFMWDATLAHGERINELLANLDIPPAEAADADDDFDDLDELD